MQKNTRNKLKKTDKKRDLSTQYLTFIKANKQGK